MSGQVALVPEEQIEQTILLIRGQRVMLDAALAQLYGVKTKELNKTVKRNVERFPADFVFQLTPEEAESLRFQFRTSNAPSPLLAAAVAADQLMEPEESSADEKPSFTKVKGFGP